MELNRKISENVRGYIVVEDSLLWNNSFEVFKSTGEEDSQILKSENSLQEIMCKGSQVYINDSHGNSYIGDTDLHFHENIHVKKVIDSNRILISYQGGTYMYSLDSNERRLLFDYRIYQSHVNDHKLYYIKESEIRSFDLKGGIEDWSYCLNTLGQYLSVSNEEKQYAVKAFLGSYNGLLIIQLANATILFLDIVSGQVSKVLHVNTLCPLPQGVFYDDAFAPHIIDGQLIWLNNQRLLEINLVNYIIKVVKNYYDEPKDKQFRFMHNSYFGDKIYFVADYGWQYVTPSRIGVMDYTTGEVIWNKQLDKTGGLPEPPKVTANKICIRTAKGDLYVFDKSDQLA